MARWGDTGGGASATWQHDTHASTTAQGKTDRPDQPRPRLHRAPPQGRSPTHPLPRLPPLDCDPASGARRRPRRHQGTPRPCPLRRHRHRLRPRKAPPPTRSHRHPRQHPQPPLTPRTGARAHGNGGEHPWCSPPLPSTTAVSADQSRQNRHSEKPESAEVNLQLGINDVESLLFEQFAPDFTMNEHLIANTRSQQRLQTLNTLNRIDCPRHWSCNLLDEAHSKVILSTRLRRFSG